MSKYRYRATARGIINAIHDRADHESIRDVKPLAPNWYRVSSQRLGMLGKGGVWVWIVLFGAGSLYETLAFADGKDGKLTISQVIKRLRRAGGLAGTIILAVILAVLYIVLNLHWVAEVF